MRFQIPGKKKRENKWHTLTKYAWEADPNQAKKKSTRLVST